MKRLRKEPLEFLTTAPRRWTFSAHVAAPQEVVFDAISADPSTWSWFPGFTSGRYVGEGPFGLGAKREIKVGPTTYRETVVAWQRPRRWAYRVEETTIPLARALVEEWTVASAGAGSRVGWTFAIDPGAVFRMILPVAPMVLGRVFRKGMANLGRQLSG